MMGSCELGVQDGGWSLEPTFISVSMETGSGLGTCMESVRLGLGLHNLNLTSFFCVGPVLPMSVSECLLPCLWWPVTSVRWLYV